MSEQDIKKILEEASKGEQGQFQVQDCGEGANYSRMYKVIWWREDPNKEEEAPAPTPAKKKVADKADK